MNWIEGAEPGTWTRTTDGISGALTIGLSLISVVFFGLMTTALGQPGDVQGNVQSYVTTLVDSLSALAVGLFYMIILVIFLSAWWGESDGEIPFVAVIDLGETRDWVLWIPIGLALGIVFALSMRWAVGSFFPFETLVVFGVNVQPLILFVAPILAIPIAEELFFGGVMTPTVAEDLGVIAAIVVVGLVWVLWHIGTYSSSGTVLGVLFLFRAAMTVVILWTQSLLPAIVAHVVVNVHGVLFV